MLSIPLIRRDLVSDLVGRHIYLFGAGSLVDDVLNPLAEAGALEGTVVLTEHEGARVAAAVLFRPDLPAGEVPVFSAIATLALSDAFEDEEVSVSPVWPDRLIVDGETVVRGIVEATSSVDHVRHVILGAEIDVPLPECGRRRREEMDDDVNEDLGAARWLGAGGSGTRYRYRYPQRAAGNDADIAPGGRGTSVIAV
jgi:hypothetical protein